MLDAWLISEEHLKVITTKVNQAIGLLQKLQKTLLRLVLITMYKAFARPYLDYGIMIYDEAYNDNNKHIYLFNLISTKNWIILTEIQTV